MSASLSDVLPFSYMDIGKNFDFFRRIEEMCGGLKQAVNHLTNPRFEKIFSLEGFPLAYAEHVRLYHLGLNQRTHLGASLDSEQKNTYFANVAQSVFEKLTERRVYFNQNAFKLFLSLLRRKYLSDYGTD